MKPEIAKIRDEGAEANSEAWMPSNKEARGYEVTKAICAVAKHGYIAGFDAAFALLEPLIFNLLNKYKRDTHGNLYRDFACAKCGVDELNIKGHLCAVHSAEALRSTPTSEGA